jgi:hypothetical protein
MIYLTFDSDGKANLHYGRGKTVPKTVRETDKETQITTTRFTVGDGKCSVRVLDYDNKGNAGMVYRLDAESLQVLVAKPEPVDKERA